MLAIGKISESSTSVCSVRLDSRRRVSIQNNEGAISAYNDNIDENVFNRDVSFRCYLSVALIFTLYGYFNKALETGAIKHHINISWVMKMLAVTNLRVQTLIKPLLWPKRLMFLKLYCKNSLRDTYFKN